MLAPYLALIVWRLRNRHTPETQPPPLSPGAAALAIGYLCYVANFALAGFGLWIVASVLVPRTAISPLVPTGEFASSWLIGFVTPGARAGFGERVGVLVLGGAACKNSERRDVAVSVVADSLQQTN